MSNSICKSGFFSAVGHPVRQEILDLLKKEGELHVGSIVERLHVSQSTVSHHLSILKKSKVLNTREDGTRVYYSICRETIEKCCCDLREFIE